MTSILHTIEAFFLVPIALIDLLTRSPHEPQPEPAICQPLAPAPSAPQGIAPPPIESLSVSDLRRLAQSRGISTAGGIRVSKARRAALLTVLGP
jgi:hypothetical protein